VFFFPLLLSGAGHERLIKSNWWRRTALGCIAVAAGLLVINPSRPLFPARTIIAKLLTIRPESRAISLLQNVYSAPDLLADTRHWVETHVPADEPLVGYAGIVNAKLEPGLWLPLGSRRVARITATDTREQLLASGIRYVVIEEAPSLAVRNLDDWRAIYHATLIASTSFRKEGSRNNVCQVYVLRLEPPGKPAPPT